MSHFCGLVILTPDYKKSLDDSLAEYDENMEVDEYIYKQVTDKDIVDFLEYYVIKNDSVKEAYLNSIIGKILDNKIVLSYEDFIKCNINSISYYYNNYISLDEQAYADFWKKKHPHYFANFAKYYAKYGEKWNGNTYRQDKNGVWQNYSTYNPQSQYDYYCLGGRWDKSIKTKSGELTNMCLLDEIDWAEFKDEDYGEETTNWNGEKYRPLKDNVKFHYTKSNVPYALVINGEWHSRGKMGWWGMSSNENENWEIVLSHLLEGLPNDSEVYNMDFHI